MDFRQAVRNTFHTIHDHFLPLMLATDEPKLRNRVVSEINPIIWICWHILRTEDMYLNTVMFRQEQVFHSGDWKQKLAIDTSHTGTGMTVVQADELSREVDKEALLDYNKAVLVNSLQHVEQADELRDDEYDTAERIESRLRSAEAFPDGVLQERATAYSQFPLSGGITGITMHGFMHIGQYLAITKPL